MAGTMDRPITARNTARPPMRSVRIPNGIRPRLPSSTGSASSQCRLAWSSTPARCRRMGIIAEAEPKTAKQQANAAVPSASCRGCRPVRWQRFLVKSGRATVRRRRRHGSRREGSLAWPIKSIKIPEQPEIEQRQIRLAVAAGQINFFIAAQIGVHRRRQQPQLQDHHHRSRAQNAVDDRHLLLRGVKACFIRAHFYSGGINCVVLQLRNCDSRQRPSRGSGEGPTRR